MKPEYFLKLILEAKESIWLYYQGDNGTWYKGWFNGLGHTRLGIEAYGCRWISIERLTDNEPENYKKDKATKSRYGLMEGSPE